MKKDFLIVGAGLAGCLCAWELAQRKKSFLLIDNISQQSASEVAAGIINPITGKRFILIDQFPTYFEKAQHLYNQFEHLFNTSFLTPTPIHRIFKNIKEYQFWNEERNKPEQQGYIKQYNSAGIFKNYIRDAFGSLSFQGYTVDGSKLISSLRHHFQDHLKDEIFCYENLKIAPNQMTYKDNAFNHVIFCEGYTASSNPFFDWIPFKHAKGEILIIETREHAQPNGILNFGKWIQPLKNGWWKVGSTFEWEDINTQPSPAGCKELTEALKLYFPLEYNIKEHLAGVRPVVRDLNPLLGTHPEISSLSMLNGLGSKGYLYAPTYAEQLIQHLCENKALPEKLSIQRFSQI